VKQQKSIITTYTLFPFLEFLLFYVSHLIKQAKDQGRTFPVSFPKQTDCQTIEQYQKLYSGPTYQIDWKLAMLIFICYQSLS